ncbi:hypothetical protein PSPO01_03694 [Paraphaeosphaeria sporulosa]
MTHENPGLLYITLFLAELGARGLSSLSSSNSLNPSARSNPDKFQGCALCTEVMGRASCAGSVQRNDTVCGLLIGVLTRAGQQATRTSSAE